MNSLPDFDPDRAVPLRFGQGSRVRAKPAAPTPAMPPDGKDLAAELEAALMRDLKVVAAALPESPEPDLPAERPLEESRPVPARPKMPPTPGLSAFAPKPKSQPAAPKAATPAPKKVSPYAPTRRTAANSNVERHRPEPAPAPAKRAAPRAWDVHSDRADVVPEWLMEAGLDLDPRTKRAPRRRIGRSSVALAIVLGLMLGGGALVTFRSAAAPERPPAGDSPDLVTASVLGAERSTVEPLPRPAVATETDPGEIAPPMALGPLIDADASAGPLLLAAEASGDAGVEPPLRPEPELRTTATDMLDVAVAPHADEPAAPQAKPTPVPKVAGGAARITIDVNMRSGPDNSAPAIRVLRAGSTVKVLRCDYWCEVDAGGERGWVFKRFLRNG